MRASGGRSGEVVADLGFGNRRQPKRWRRRGCAAQPDGDAESHAEDGSLDQRQADQDTARFWRARIGLQRNDSGAPLAPAEDPQRAERDELGDHQAPVAGGQQVGRRNPDHGIDDAAERHRDPTPQRDRGEPPRRQADVVTAAQAVGEQGEQATGPQAGGDEVNQQAVGGQVVRAAGRRVTGQPQRDER